MAYIPKPTKCGGVALNVNEVCLKLTSSTESDVSLFVVSSQCIECDYTKLGSFAYNTSSPLVLDSMYPINYYVKTDNTTICKDVLKLEDYGVYELNVTSSNCTLTTVEPGEHMWINLLTASVTYVILAVLYNISKLAFTSHWFQRWRQGNTFTELQSDLGSPESRDPNSPEQARRRKRLSRIGTVDTFRGIAIVLMIFVNYGGGEYSAFKHSVWNGLTIADLVFPWFVWVMGFGIAISLRSHLRTSVSRRRILLKIIRRSVFLIALGVMLNALKQSHHGSTDLTTLRYPGVLQRLGVTYFLVASLETFFMKPQGLYQYGPWLVCQDLCDSWKQWFIIILMTSIQPLVTFLLPLGDCPRGYLGPGGLHESSRYFNCVGGAAGVVDRTVFGDNHMYHHPTSQQIYSSILPYDPEGILGCFTSVLIAYFGVQAGRIMSAYHLSTGRIIRWVCWAIITGIAAGFLCDWRQEGGIIPINKNLWSISFVLATASLAFMVHTVLYVMIDHWKLWSGKPFVYAGMNSILLYVGHEVLIRTFPFSWYPVLNTHYEYLFMNLTAVSLWIIISYLFYRKNVFIVL